jgi:hypothetical protein
MESEVRSGKRNALRTYPHSDTAALAGLLGGKRVGFTEVGTPVATSNGNNAEL